MSGRLESEIIDDWITGGVLGYQEITIPQIQPKQRWQVGDYQEGLFTTRVSLRADGRAESSLYTSEENNFALVPFGWESFFEKRNQSSVNLRFVIMEKVSIAALPRHLSEYWARVNIGPTPNTLIIYSPRIILPAPDYLETIDKRAADKPMLREILYRSVLLSAGQFGTAPAWGRFLLKEKVHLSSYLAQTIDQALADWKEIRPKSKKFRLPHGATEA